MTPSTFHSRLEKLISFTNLFLHSHSYSVWTAFTDLNLYWIKGELFVCFSFWLRVLDWAVYSAFESTLIYRIVLQWPIPDDSTKHCHWNWYLYYHYYFGTVSIIFSLWLKKCLCGVGFLKCVSGNSAVKFLILRHFETWFDCQVNFVRSLLFVMYTTPLSTLISSLSLNHHLYADDTQLIFLLPSS